MKNQTLFTGLFFLLALGLLNGQHSKAENIYSPLENSQSVTQLSASLSLRVYLEGALQGNFNETGIDGNPLMRDNLRESTFTGQNYLPAQDPYTINATLNFDLPSHYEKTGPHLLEDNLTITNPDQVFGVSGDNAIVDWVFVELRSKDNFQTAIASRSGLLQRDGDVVDLDGVSPLLFQGVTVDSAYVVVDHRTHLAVMSQKVSLSEELDFTSPDFETFHFGTTINEDYDFEGSQMYQTTSGYYALWSGDFNCDGRVKYSAPDDDLNILFMDVFLSSPEATINYDEAFGYFQGDFNLDGKAKFDNPLDDKNALFGRLLFYPLNISFIANFNYLIQQVPEKIP